MNSRITGIDETDLLLMIGCNPRNESPVLNARIRKAVGLNGL
jgi:NADH dehydrogenase/NADH:ubiquinone oxidoreductase subunit G